MTEKLRLTKPQLPEIHEIAKYFEKSNEMRWFTNFGPCYRELQDRLLSYTRASDVLIVTNATVALEIVLKATRKKLENKSERLYVLTPSYTFAATTTAIRSAGFTPIYVDVDLDDWHASTSQVNYLASKYKDKIACFLFCSTFGTTPAVEKLKSWKRTADAISVPLYIDCAAGFGSNFDSTENEISVADATIYSMHATKPFAVGEGGIIAGKKEIIESCRKISNFDFDGDRNFGQFGTNAKISEIMCATALAVLDKYDSTLLKRRSVVKELQSNFQDLTYLSFQSGSENSAWQSLYVQINDKIKLGKIIQNLELAAIEFRRDWSKPTHTSIPSAVKTALDVTSYLAEHCLTLPLWVEMETEHIERITAAVSDVLN
jgi:dTDP-4-amino-4,6-dideoxygalactose transaminase